MRSNLSSAVAGGEGLFNLGVVGNGVLCLESPSPKEELIEVTLQDDVLKVDGNMAIAWAAPLILPSSARARRCSARQLPGKVWSTSTAEPERCCWLRWAATINLCAATGGRTDEPCKPCPKAALNQREILAAYLPPIKKKNTVSWIEQRSLFSAGSFVLSLFMLWLHASCPGNQSIQSRHKRRSLESSAFQSSGWCLPTGRPGCKNRS